MIVSHICGGLGNQLSEYSFGRAYAERVGVPHFVDCASYSERGGDYKLHRYCLDRLSINPSIITAEKMEAAGIKLVLKETRLRYNPAIWDTAIESVYIDMYCADYRYSEPIIGKLREELTPMVPMTGEFKDLHDEMRDGETVSMHVRLQDYLRNPHCLVLPITYYRDALKLVAKDRKNVRVYLFTDQQDILIKYGFNPGLPYTIIDHGPDCNIEDMTLMTACKHHIVANSSYSFWGAWLDGKGGGITTVPDLYHDPMGKQILETYGEVIQPSYPKDWNVIPVKHQPRPAA